MAKEQRKRCIFSVVEEAVRNPDYKNFRAGRIEVYDNQDTSGYACYEARFMIPIEFMNVFMETWDAKESDEMPYIHFHVARPQRPGYCRRLRSAAA